MLHTNEQLKYTVASKGSLNVLNYQQDQKRDSQLNQNNQYTTNPIINNRNQLKILDNDVEGQSTIENIFALQLTIEKLLLTIFLIIISFGIYALILRNSIKLRLKSLYIKCNKLSDCTHFLVQNIDQTYNIVKKQIYKNKNFGFENRHLKYEYDEQNYGFIPVYYSDVENHTLEQLYQKHKNGLENKKENILYKKEKYGLCKIHIPIPTLIEYFLQVLTEIFFLFQYVSMAIWIAQGFIVFAAVMILTSLISTLVNYILLRISLNKLRKFANIQIKIDVYRDGKLIVLDSQDLLPGDVFIYKNKMMIPCDSLLIQGDVLVNESTLTGESIPIPKLCIKQADNQQELFNFKNMKRHILFEGTKIIQKNEEIENLGVVLRTGYCSYKGQMFRSMLYPKAIEFEFYRKGIYFLLILIVLALIVYFIFFYKIIQNLTIKLSILLLFHSLTNMIPPAVPVMFSLCQTVALVRLGYSNIIAVNPSKTVVASEIQVFCFDKTGTLTKNNMDVIGFCDSNIEDLITEVPNQIKDEKQKILLDAFGTCHGVYLDDGEYLGDELDVKMVQFSGFNIRKGKECKLEAINGNSILKVIKFWEFESQYQRMGCLVQDQNGKNFAFVKGSPEMMQQICSKNTLDNYKFQEKLSMFANMGYRVIGFGYKELSQNINLKDVKREEIEIDLIFLGLLILENKLKEDSAENIQILKNAEINCKIISGDNLLTTVKCAKDSKILDPKDNIIILNSLKDAFYLNKPSEKVDIIQLFNSKQIDFKLGITGTALIDIQQMNNQQLLKNILDYTTVFARSKPEQKTEIIYMYQTLFNLKVGMIGDGANDCSAIKQADIGVSFCEADASFSAPFSYQGKSISCLISILAEGRCVISNMIECYRHYVTINVYKYAIFIILIYEYSNFSSFQLMYINYFIAIPLMSFVSLSKPLKTLSKIRPNCNLFTKENALCMGGQFIFGSACLYFCYLHYRQQDFYQDIKSLKNGVIYNDQNIAVNIIFLATNMYFLVSSMVYYVSMPFKQIMYKNRVYFIWMLIFFIFSILQYLFIDIFGFKIFKFDKELYTQKIFLAQQLAIVLIFIILSIFWEEGFIKQRFIFSKITKKQVQ
ncbi:hypothetical protein IMG5_160690 [Ichthyophthirius multifiliis]|uniref:P-type ATPase A domain-containing protein n=1 Tax=Ichthyophthirius multifiliis TaxID=5932 RepID=G0QZZ0_ICHMU|nr:hypothetical protein IMG5_160690 [Ichthyophthirius multifiliis]EGR29200.1 hypothetical protein IMG5_160690 [Ichthyophthirius multifiliis]|eukprot:XP_004030436.1 hypothetical protein IMG5_160690 [Ichthyophthirius multifiliis]